jgi:large subunit ribosomal protein L23
MDLSRVIIGPVVTEKSERLKAGEDVHTYTLRIAPTATKIDVKNALKAFYDVEVTAVRIVRTQPKTRLLPMGGTMEKRHAFKKALVTLGKKSKPLDLAAFQTIAS